MDIFKNIAVNLTATGMAAVMIAWLLCFTLLALFGTTDMAKYALYMLGTVGIGLLIVLSRPPQE